MSALVSIRNMLKWLVLIYSAVLIVIVHKLHDETFNQTLAVGNMQLKFLQNRSGEVRIQNVTHFVYINQTKVIYKSKPQQPNVGPGENGIAVPVPDSNKFSWDDYKHFEERKKTHGFNTYISDLVSLTRKLPDLRPEACKKIVYPDHLPPVSVVIIFRDELPSILLRTAYSVFINTPPDLIKEIILVDDGSENQDLKRQVDIHVKVVDKLKLIRHAKPLGLMLAREAGIEAVTSAYFAVMDGHMEVSPGWLEPLIYRLIQQPKALLCSNVGQIKQEDFSINIDDPKNVDPIFDQQFPFFDQTNLDQLWVPFSDSFRKHRNHSVAPIEYGTIQGMMAVMRKDFFLELGGFDPGMKIWGSEQMELSVKVWLCGGRVEMIPCSKAAHMFRITPWGGVKTGEDYGALNKARMVEVWMAGEYKDILDDYLQDKEYNMGDLAPRHRIRVEHNCKPYQYFVDRVKQFSDVYFPENVRYRGRVYNALTNKCFDNAKINETYKLISYPCHKQVTQNQYFILTEDYQIRASQGGLLDVLIVNATSAVLVVKRCPQKWISAESQWSYGNDRTIVHGVTGMCLTIDTNNEIKLMNCAGTNDQLWEWNKAIQHEKPNSVRKPEVPEMPVIVRDVD